MWSRTVPGGVKPPGSTGERRRALRRGSLNEGRDFRSSGTRGRSFAFDFASTGSGIGSNSLVKRASATMNDISLRTTGRRESSLVRNVSGDYPRGVGTGAVGRA